jgi:hypothetical protein
LTPVQKNTAIKNAQEITGVKDRDSGSKSHARQLLILGPWGSLFGETQLHSGSLGKFRVLGKEERVAQDHRPRNGNSTVECKVGNWIRRTIFFRYGTGPDPTQSLSVFRDHPHEIQLDLLCDIG